MQRVSVKHRADFRAAEREPEMAGLAGVNGIHGEAARFVGGAGEGIEVEVHRLEGKGCEVIGWRFLKSRREDAGWRSICVVVAAAGDNLRRERTGAHRARCSEHEHLREIGGELAPVYALGLEGLRDDQHRLRAGMTEAQAAQQSANIAGSASQPPRS
jgi:hypothetical protein